MASPRRWSRHRTALGLVAGLAAGVVAFSPLPAAAQVVDLELVLAVDTSSSVSAEEFDLQMHGLANAFRHPDVLAAIEAAGDLGVAVALIQWSDTRKQFTAVDWSLLRGAAASEAFAQEIDRTPRILVGGGTAIGGALNFSLTAILNNAYEGRRKVIDISGDGPQINGRPLPIIRAAALNAGITINALVVNRPGGVRPGPDGGPLTDHYSRDVIGGFGAFMMTVEGRERMAGAVRRKMVLEIADSRPTGCIGAQTALVPPEGVSETD
ncbi:MAG: DUF1194 domain-containing protein [Rhodospirillales bacterium]|nr:DUF1194 domain-containing protein [Rhodospirillales bacterium]